MKKIPSKELINRYIDEFHLQQYMDTPLADTPSWLSLTEMSI